MITLIYSYFKIYEKENYDNKMPYICRQKSTYTFNVAGACARAHFVSDLI